MGMTKKTKAAYNKKSAQIGGAAALRHFEEAGMAFEIEDVSIIDQEAPPPPPPPEEDADPPPPPAFAEEGRAVPAIDLEEEPFFPYELEEESLSALFLPDERPWSPISLWT